MTFPAAPSPSGGAATDLPHAWGASVLPTAPPIPATVQAAMKRLGLSTAELARRSGVPRPNLSAWLHGRADINTRTLQRVLDALGLAFR